MQALHGEPEACTGFYTQCGTGLENQQKIPRAHTGFYTQCGKGLENQRHRDAQAFTLRGAEGWGTRENPKSTHRLLHSVWQRAGEPETHDTHRLLHSERHRAGEPERHSECIHRLLHSMQHRKDGTNGICSYQSLHSYEEHVSVTSHVFRMRDLEHIGLKRRGFFFGRIFNDHVITNAIRGMLSNYYYNVYYARKFMYYVVHLLFYCMSYLILSYFVLPFVIYFVLSIFIKLYEVPGRSHADVDFSRSPCDLFAE